MLRTIIAAMLASVLAIGAFAQDENADQATTQGEEAGQASYSALMITAGAQLDGLLLAMAQRKFDSTQQAIELTQEAIGHGEQLNATLERLAGTESATRSATLVKAEEQTDEIIDLLRAQRAALKEGDRDAFASARIAIYQRISDLPDRVFVGPRGQPENER